ncbi:MAG: tol-pal system YbgF family protein [Rhodothermales bacterium]
MAVSAQKSLRFIYWFTPLLLLTLVTGCASSEKLLEKANSSEEKGEYARSARYYISVLEKKPDWEEARDGLARVGTIAIDNLIDNANAQEETGEYDEAIDTLDKLDDLKADARGVGINLAVPSDYDSYRERLSEAAVVSLIRKGDRAEEEGEWEEAIETYKLVSKKYKLTVDQQEEMILAEAGVFTKWAEQEIERGRYRRSFDLASDAVVVLGEEHPRAAYAFEIQDRAIDEGTRFVAFLPIWQTDDVNDNAPSGLIEEIDDLLQYDYWANPPLFIEQADPVQLRRELRRLRYDDRLITRSEASNIGNAVNADYVVITQAVLFQFEEKRMREKTKKTETKGRNSVDTTYIEQSFTGELQAELEYRIIDMETRKEVGDGTVTADADAKLKRGVYAGDYLDLDLSRSERKLFDEEEIDLAIRELEDEIIDDLAPRLSEEVFDAILRKIE